MVGFLRRLYFFFNRNFCRIYQEKLDVTQTILEGNNRLFDQVTLMNCYVGRGTYIQKKSHLLFTRIGRYCSIADYVFTCVGTHPTDYLSTYPAFYYDTTEELGFTYHKGEPLYKTFKYPQSDKKYQIIIGNDVWIGSHVLIMGGVVIGDGAIIAAGSVETKDVPPYSIVAGVPAKEIRKRFSEEIIRDLMEMHWWDKSEEWIKENKHLFSQPYSKLQNKY